MAAEELHGIGQLRGSVTDVEFMFDNEAVVVLLLGGFLRGVGMLAVSRRRGCTPPPTSLSSTRGGRERMRVTSATSSVRIMTCTLSPCW